MTGLPPPLAYELVRAATGEAALTSDSAYGTSNLVEEQPAERQAEPTARARRALGPYSRGGTTGLACDLHRQHPSRFRKAPVSPPCR